MESSQHRRLDQTQFEPFVGTEEVAEFLSKPVSWIHHNAGPRGIPRTKIGNQWRYRLSEVEKWLMKYQVGLN